jgi:putative transcriptional regulator
METTKLTDHFIIAMPALLDENFDHTVTYICEHDENGTFGIIINRETDITIKEVISQMEINTETSQPNASNIKTSHAEASEAITGNSQKHGVYIGGPVQQNRGFVLHKPPGNWGSTLKINEQMALTSSRDILEAIANNQGPEQSIITLGYAGWGPGQLEQEIVANTWLSCPAEEQIIFNTPTEQRWQAAANLLGVDLQLISNDPGHA